MKEKNVIKISLSTIFIIIAIIVIIVMGVFIYKLNNEKTIEIKKSSELQSQVNNLNGKVSELQGKIDTISNTINNNNSINNDNITNTNNMNNLEKAININTGSFSVKNITEDELNDNVIGWINILENNKFEIPRTWRNVYL